MNVTVLSHCAMDTIHLMGSTYQQPGGDACYSGLMAQEFGVDVSLQTKFGPDFPVKYLEGPRISYHDAVSEQPTTRFEIHIDGMDRRLYLRNECEAIEPRPVRQDGIIITPIYHEVDTECTTGQKGYVLLNPQGLLRKARMDGLVETAPTELSLDGVDALKVNPLEIQSLTGNTGDAGLRTLQKMGADAIIRTNGRSIAMYHKNMLYNIQLPNKDIRDTTGLGAILCGAFICTMIKEKDLLWAFCFAGGAVQAALDTKSQGLLKIPRRGAVQTNASYFYNLVEYRNV